MSVKIFHWTVEIKFMQFKRKYKQQEFKSALQLLVVQKIPKDSTISFLTDVSLEAFSR